MKRKIVLIGIDGGSWKVIDPLLKKGKLPWFRKIIKDGLHGVLYCNILDMFQKIEDPSSRDNEYRQIKDLPQRDRGERFIDPVYWTTLSTGLTPEKHGINDCTEKGPNGIEVPISRVRKKKLAIWEILARYGRNIGVIGWLVNYPPPKLDSYTISMPLGITSQYPKVGEKLSIKDFELIPSLPRLTYPRSLWQKLKAITPDEDVMIFVKKLLHLRYATGLNFNLIYDNLHLKWMKYLLEKYPQPDFLTVCLYGVHYFSHLFWDCLEGEKKRFKGIHHQKRRERYGSIVEEYYQYLDKKICEVIKLIDKDSIIMVVSEHGMSTSRITKRFIFMDLIYKKLGFLKFKDNYKIVDEENTQVYDNRNLWGIFSVRKGYIKSANPYRVFKYLKRDLGAIKTQKGEQLFPTIIFNKKDNSFLVMPNYKAIKYNTKIIIKNKVYSVSKFIEFAPHYSLHGPEGIFVISGNGFPKIKVSSWISILDIAPTILYLLGIKYKGLDGKVIAEVKKGGYIDEKG